jgi:hypothetical protein
MVDHSSTTTLNNLVQAIMAVALSSTMTRSSLPTRSAHAAMVAPCSTMARSSSTMARSSSTMDRSQFSSSTSSTSLLPGPTRLDPQPWLSCTTAPEDYRRAQAPTLVGLHPAISTSPSRPCPLNDTPPCLPYVASSYNVQYPEVNMIRRYPVKSSLLGQDPVLPLFFVNEVPHPYCHGFEGQDCSSYANRHTKTLYHVSACPYHGFFRYYSSAWDASTMVQGASVTSPHGVPSRLGIKLVCV